MGSQVQLKQGDYVLYEDIEDDRQASLIAEKFLDAGANKGRGYPYLSNSDNWKTIFWDSRTNNVNRGGRRDPELSRRLTPEQVLGTSQDDDDVNSPARYKREADDKLIDVRDAILALDKTDPPNPLNLECIEGMVSCLSSVDQIRGYLRGNSFKYRWRYEDKERVKSLKKAAWYERRLEKLEEIEEKHAA